MGDERTVVFTLDDMVFEYDEENSETEDRYDTIGDTSAGSMVSGGTVIGNISRSDRMNNDILFVVYTERKRTEENGTVKEVTRLISARMATNFERGLYYGKHV